MNIQNKVLALLKKITLLLISFLSTNLAAAELRTNKLQLENLVVTESYSQKSSFFDRPYSGNVFVIKDLEEHGINKIQDTVKEIPNLNFQDFGMRSFHSVLGIRGLTNTPFFSAPSVIFYVDDIPYGSAFSYTNQLFGVENIEVYRGPQGALFGKNSYGGVINVKSRKPENQIKSKFSAEYASFNSWKTNGYIDGGLIKDKLFFSLGGSFARSDGYMSNTFLNNTPDQEEHISGRASITWRPSSKWDVSMVFNIEDFKDATPHISSLDSKDPLAIQSNQPGKLEQNANSQALRISYKNDQYQLLSITSRRDWQLNPLFIDADFSPAAFLTLQFDHRQTQWNQEFRISSKTADFNWVTGAYISLGKFRRDRLLKAFNSTVAFQQGKLEDENYAIFGNLTYHSAENIRINTGLRFDYVNKHVDREINKAARLQNDKDFFHISPKVSIDYLFSNDFLLYTSSALAFKPGGFSVAAESPETSEFDSETMWASEMGLKLRWPDHQGLINLAFFYYKINDYQVERRESRVNYSIVNVPKSTSYGMELETSVELFPGLQLESNFGYTHIRFDQYLDPTTAKNLKDNQPPYIPEKSALIALQYKHVKGYFLRTEWIWNDKTYYDDINSDTFKQDDYSTLNARLGFQGENFDIYLFGENLTNSQYYSFILPSFNAGTPSKPRTLGVSVGLKY